MRPPRYFSTMIWILIVIATACAGAARAQSPVKPVTEDRWGALRPRAILGDTTRYHFNYEPGCNEPFWFDLDVEGGLIYAGTGNTFEIWDGRSNANRPMALQRICKPLPEGGVWRKTDKDFYVNSISVERGMVALGLEGGMGLVLVDATDPRQARPVWQWEGQCPGCLNVKDVHATTIAGKRYAFAADESLTIQAFDMDTHLALGALPGVQSVWKVSGVGSLVAVRWSSKAAVWDVSSWAASGRAPIAVGSVGIGVMGVALWESGGKTYLAATESTGRTAIYKVPSMALVADLETPGTTTVTVSQDDGASYLYVGSERTGGTAQREFLFDVSDPVKAKSIGSASYWTWYYENSPTGFRNVAPYTAHVHNGRLYRSGWSLLDVHELTGESEPEPDPDPGLELLFACGFEVPQQ